MADWRERPDGADTRSRSSGAGGSRQGEAEQVKESMGQQTWASAIGEVWRAAARHKVISGLIALCVAGSLAGIALVGSASGASGQPTRPAAVAAGTEAGRAGSPPPQNRLSCGLALLGATVGLRNRSVRSARDVSR